MECVVIGFEEVRMEGCGFGGRVVEVVRNVVIGRD